MKTLKITADKARQLYPTSSEEFKALLAENFSKKELVGEITERIKSYEDACNELGIEPMDEKSMLAAGFRPDEIARRKIEAITLALNEGKVMDWNSEEQKWFPWFNTSSGFAFNNTNYDKTTKAWQYR